MAPVTFLPPPAPASSTRLLLPPAAILGLAVLAYIICLGLVFALRNCLLSRGCAACDGDGLCSGSSWCWDRCAACAHACDIMVPTPLTCHDRCCSVVPWLPPGCDCTCAWQPPQCDACNCICFEIRLR